MYNLRFLLFYDCKGFTFINTESFHSFKCKLSIWPKNNTFYNFGEIYLKKKSSFAFVSQIAMWLMNYEAP